MSLNLLSCFCFFSFIVVIFVVFQTLHCDFGFVHTFLVFVVFEIHSFVFGFANMYFVLLLCFWFLLFYCWVCYCILNLLFKFWDLSLMFDFIYLFFIIVFLVWLLCWLFCCHGFVLVYFCLC